MRGNIPVMNTFLNAQPSRLNPITIAPREEVMEWLTIDCGGSHASAGVSRFRTAAGLMECHVTVRLNGNGNAREQADHLQEAYRHALNAAGLDASSAVLRRVFCSDEANQTDLFHAPPPLSHIGQPPLPTAQWALWAYHLHNPKETLEMTSDGTTLSCRRGELTHHWTNGLIHASDTTSHGQTHCVFKQYATWLHSQNMNLKDHVVRTWWFVKDMDADYQGLVDARNEFFDTQGLTADTHSIASTGITGIHPDAGVRVSLESYAIGGLRPEQVEFLNAPDFLCPTHDYGVAFERATAVSYADRRHIFISGTASIDRHGEILHPGDVIGQLGRTLENIKALLSKASATLGDLASILVYLRNREDAAVIETALRESIGNIPFILVHAPVCRPGWLIEIEGLAVVPANLPDLPDF